MTYINVGAMFDDGKGGGPVRVATKKALREALAASPGDVTFDVTSMLLAQGAPSTYRATEIPEDAVMTVTGPDPYKNRKWYASVAIRNGEVKVTA